MSDRLDRALEVLDTGAQRAGDVAVVGMSLPEECWRCLVEANLDDVGLCFPCAADMRDDKTTAPAPMPDLGSVAFEEWMAARLGRAARAAADHYVAQSVHAIEGHRPTHVIVDELVDDEAAIFRRSWIVAATRPRSVMIHHPIYPSPYLRARAEWDVALARFARTITTAFTPFAQRLAALFSPTPTPPVPAKAAHTRRYQRRRRRSR